MRNDIKAGFFVRHATALEWLGMVGVLCLGWVLAQPLTQEAFNWGLGGRYGRPDTVALDVRNLQTTWLLAHLHWVLAVQGVGLYVAAGLSRSALPRATATVAISGLWLWVAAWQMQWLTGLGAQVAAGLFVGLLVWLMRRARQRSGRARYPQRRRVPLQGWVLPGWYLFTSLGTIWLLDYAAGTYPGLRFIGLKHVQEVIWAHAVLTMVAANADGLMGLLARSLAAIDRAAPRPLFGQASRRLRLPHELRLPALYMAWAGVVVVLHLVLGSRHSATTAELLRIPFYALGGWAMVRWADNGHAERALSLWLLMAIAIAVGLVGTSDFGPLLLLCLCVALFAGVWVARLGKGRRRAVWAGLALALALCLAGLWLIAQFAHLMPGHIGFRARAIESWFTGKLVYLSQLRWLAADTPWAGYGLTHVPWCGTYASLDPQAFACDRNRSAALPWELHSDFVFAGIAALWGAPRAWFITLVLSLWLIGLVKGQRQPDPTHPAAFRYGVLLLFVCVMLAQLFFSAMGSVGLVVVTGVTVPLLGHGASMLLSCALFCGLALNRTAPMPYQRAL